MSWQRATALLVVTLGAGTVAGVAWLLAAAIRHLSGIGAVAAEAMVKPLAWIGLDIAWPAARILQVGGRSAGWLMAAAWAVFALDAALHYLILY